MSEAVRFLHPQVFYLLLLLPAVCLASRRHLYHLDKIREHLNFGPRLPRISHLSARGRFVLTASLLLLLLVVLIFSLARPQIQRLQVSEVVRKLDVIFLLDTSPSMQAQDILPSRLERARHFIKDVVARESIIDRVGLVSFSDSSVILSYLTSDIESVLFYLDYLASEPETHWGTNLGSAIESGLKVIESSRERDSESWRANRKVLVLLSDGEDHGEELRQALAESARKELRVYAVGIGSASGGFVPIGSKDGKVLYLEDDHGTRLVSRLDEGTLRHIAEVTGGRFYRSYEGSEIGAALKQILSREREVTGYREQKEWVDLYGPLISGAAILMLAALVLGKG